METKRLALLRILDIFGKYSDCDHSLKQDDVILILRRDYGIEIERKAVGRNISLLKEAGFEVESDKSHSYLTSRAFEDSELRMLIDGVLSSGHITVNYSKSLHRKVMLVVFRIFQISCQARVFCR